MYPGVVKRRAMFVVFVFLYYRQNSMSEKDFGQARVLGLSMELAGVKDPNIFKEARDVLIGWESFFQIQDDYLDQYGHPDVIGKIGSDIQDNKCCWPIVAALEIATDEQKKILKENYGSWEEERVQKVKAIYSDLDIEGVYRKYEKATYKELIVQIDAMDPKTLPTPIFKIYLDNVFKRSQ